ncbi:INO80 complex, subunit Ies4 [Amylocarpus encephaloides]|uniref:INO80 complex, subunit Ies4 n=1 Tax=Amylocarpus encephaloides TaxID=45428 RepID=A0A9P7YF77_9HELO|nr:INO80 complex, subunit Ies4 [Amylocarpus encephaloides]
MAPPSKSSTAAGARRKSSKGPLMVVLKLSPKRLRAFLPSPIKEEVKEEKEPSPAKDSPSSSSNSNTIPVASSSNGDNKTESNAGTPAAAGTPVPPSLMPPPPTEGAKKKGTKRSAAVALGADGLPIPKIRGKPGPKKKARLEDGSIDHSQTAPRAANGTAHKLGPKANQGAINAGLRALDRSGKPCRKWQKGGFTLKSFTGIVWEIPRWKAPPRVKVEGTQDGSTSGDSQKENKGSQIESEKSNSAVDIVMASSPVSTPSAPPEPFLVEAIKVEPPAASEAPEVPVAEPTIEVTAAT